MEEPRERAASNEDEAEPAMVAAKLCEYQGCVGKWGRPRSINFHAGTKAAGGWVPRHFTLALWLRLEAKLKRALGPGAIVGVLGPGVPRLACLEPMAWLHQRPYMAQFQQ